MQNPKNPERPPTMSEKDTDRSATRPPVSGRSRRIRRLIRDSLSLAAFIGVLLVARASVADHYVVPTGSMRPTVNKGDRVLVNKLAYGVRLPCSNLYLWEFGGPRRGEVVVLDSPADDGVLLKRVVALPGDRVAVRSGRLVINGKEIPIEYDEDGLTERLGGVLHPVRFDPDGGPDYGPVKLPRRRYLVVGDNRGDSLDGRMFGLVRRSAILGRAVAIYYSKGSLTWKRF